MKYMKNFCDLIGNIAVIEQVKVIVIHTIRHYGTFKPVKNHSTGAASGTMFENYLWNSS